MPAYHDLCAIFARQSAIQDAAGILAWDSQTLMPTGAADGRAEQLANLHALAHDLLVAPATGDLLAEAEHGVPDLTDWDQANLREMRRLHLHATAVPSDLVIARSRATSKAEMVWREARATSNFALLCPHLKAVLDIEREVAAAKGTALGVAPYDALLDQFDPGLREAKIDPLFDRLKQELPGLLDAARRRQSREAAPLPLTGPFPIEAQRRLGEALMRTLGFDFDRGRLDTSLHPFCGGATGDVRITTRYDVTDFSRTLMGVLHETGHALYEQGRPRQWLHQPVGAARGMMLHESQSLLIEMQACRSAGFIAFLAPLVQAAFDRNDAALAPANLTRLYTHVEPGFIRVDADEITYPAHILVRYDLERAMVAGTLAIEDLPAAFNAAIHEHLGLVVTDDALGCLQDIHWPSGGWGYFPTYTLGAVTAAQLFAAACAASPDIPSKIAAGDFKPLVAWLREAVHAKGSLLDADDLVTTATGRPLDLDAYLAHLHRRYIEPSTAH